jgi:CBS domain-containing protein
VVIGYPDEQVSALADRMVATEAGRAPIIDRASGRLVGLVTRKDLMRTRGDARSAESDRLSYFLRRRKRSATTKTAETPRP